MDKIDLKLAQKERELEEYLSGLSDPTLRQILSDINALRRTKELVADTPDESPAPAASQKTSQNGRPSLPSQAGTLTIGDAVVSILKKAGHPKHVNDIMYELAAHFGLHPKNKASLTSLIRKDRQKRFTSKGGGMWDLREKQSTKPADKAVADTHSSNGASPFNRAGFSLIGSIKELLPHLSGEFSQPVVYNKLRERHPEVADRIQKASVATTLRKLQEDGLLEVTYQGYGSEPRRYRRKEG